MSRFPLVSFSDCVNPAEKEEYSVVVLGSTGSIGESTLRVIRQLTPRFRVEALCAGKQIKILAEQIREFSPKIVCVQSEVEEDALREECHARGIPLPEVVSGSAGLLEVARASEYDVMISAILGLGGMEATLESLARGKRVAMANKESLVVGGHLFVTLRESAENWGELVPVDSEHSALYQILFSLPSRERLRLVLTASGGPFLRTPLEELKRVTPEQAAAHPRWKMGRKISIDSATMMNKAFELHEAYWLFGVQEGFIDVVIHPESLVHGIVEEPDGCVYMHAACADMALPIQYALFHPRRGTMRGPSVLPGNSGATSLHFEKLDSSRFPAVELARRCLRASGNEALVFHIANEFAVEQFEEGRILFDSIVPSVANAVEQFSGARAHGVAELWDQVRELRVRLEELS
ncbi:MAG: 1-deoxy-D-xylulose-5-phosphate reductoisomerase [Bdellovibrionales bacterium]|nr:1-deoxy-D-xylulose-5-phosphate reductoisomerase [Bdellovibrionales bacterium]